jgi:diadenosine tetraphosphate (Ap4A) HIT family hydrolase
MNQKECLFCKILRENSEILFDTEKFFVIADKFPVSKGHALIVPKHHRVDIFRLESDEWADLSAVIQKTKKHFDGKFHPDGYNIGINSGETAGQTILHLHIHIIPRYKGDVDNPRGGVRNLKKPLKQY